MSFESELAAAPQIVGFEGDEVILDALYGTVSGGGIEDRHGILFVTQYRFGISVEPGFFSGAETAWAGFPQVKAVSRSRDKLTVRADSWRLSCEVFDDSDKGVRRVGDLVEHSWRQALPANLEEEWDRVWDTIEENPEKAMELAKKILKRCPNNQMGLWLQAHGEECKEEHAAALRCLDQMIADGPPNPALAQTARARVMCLVGDLQGAVDAATTSIQLDDSADARRLRALARWDLGEPRKAIRDLRAASQLAEEDPRVWFDLGRLAYELQDNRALRDSREHLQALDLPALARSMEVAELVLADDQASAVRLACKVVDEDPTLEFAAQLLVICEPDDVGPIIERIPKLDDHHRGQLIYELGTAYVFLLAERFREARERWDQLGESFPDLFESDYLKAVTGLVRGAEALADGRAQDCVEQARPWLDDDTWRATEDAEDVACQLAWFAGRAALELEQGPLAVTWLGQAQGSRRSARMWSDEALDDSLQRAHRLAESANDIRAEDREAATGPRLATYALLRLAVDRLSASGRLPQLERRAQELFDTYDQPPLVAVMGEYSVGKSTFINALLGQPLLPSGEGVTTGTITWLRHGEAERMRVVFRDGRVEEFSSLKPVDDLVRETAEGEAARTIRHVEVFVDAPILGRVSIVDTPGLNAPFPEHRATTEQFLEDADAIVFLFNVETAGRATEAEFLAKVREHSRKAVGVVNQIDLVPQDEAEEVVEAVQEDFDGHFAAVHGVSALRALRGQAAGDEAMVAKSRITALREWLEREMLDESRAIKDDAARNKLLELLTQVGEEHTAFAQASKTQFEAIRALAGRVREWAKGELARAGEEAETELKLAVMARVSDLAEEIARCSEADSAPDLPVLSGMASSLLRDCRDGWSSYKETLLSAYDAEMSRVTTGLAEVEGEHWRGVLDGALMELRVELKAWRKDLEDYLEQVERYAEGFVEGHGIGVAVHLEVESGRKNSVSAVRPVLSKRLDFLWTRPEQAFTRWASELGGQITTSFGRLERKMQAESSRIRAEGFRKIEALAERV